MRNIPKVKLWRGFLNGLVVGLLFIFRRNSIKGIICRDMSEILAFPQWETLKARTELQMFSSTTGLHSVSTVSFDMP
jgi:hypothetical protein